MSSIPAIIGRCSQIFTPGIRVGMTLKGPRFWSGRSGLGSQVSIWLGPPAIHKRIQLLRAFEVPPSSRACNKFGRLKPAIPATPALRKLRRDLITSPSADDPCQSVNAWACCDRCDFSKFRAFMGGNPVIGVDLEGWNCGILWIVCRIILQTPLINLPSVRDSGKSAQLGFIFPGVMSTGTYDSHQSHTAHWPKFSSRCTEIWLGILRPFSWNRLMSSSPSHRANNSVVVFEI